MQSVDQLFEQVPRLQSCQRGVTVTFAPLPADEAKGHHLDKITLSDGRMVYLYHEHGCPDLAPTIGLLKTLRPY
jgi:hypothetical protein